MQQNHIYTMYIPYLLEPSVSDDAGEYVLPYVWVHGTQWIIQQHSITVGIHRSGHAHPLFLTTRSLDDI